MKHVEGWIAGAKSGVGTWGEGSSEGGRSVGNWEGSVNSISGTRQWEQGGPAYDVFGGWGVWYSIPKGV